MPTNRQLKIANPPFSPGHRACAGCGQIIAARIAAQAFGPDVIVANSTGCLEVTTTPYPESAWGIPWIHSLFENASSIASGIRAALDYKLKINSKLSKQKSKMIKVIAQGGDGATFDIGFGLISGMWERKEDILYICYDNEVYANTGIQASGATPFGAQTTTTPAGTGQTLLLKNKTKTALNKTSDTLLSMLSTEKKDMIAIALAHKLNYIAQTTVGFPDDIAQKVKKALTIKGPSYIQILVPCVPGWKIKSNQTIQIAKLAAQTGLYPLLEYINGKLINNFKIPMPKIKVEKYLELQGRFKYLFKDKIYKNQINFIQKLADENIQKYKL